MTQPPPFAGSICSTSTDEDHRLGALKVFDGEHGGVVMEFGDGTIHRDVRVRRAAPLSDPQHYVVFLDSIGRELCIVRDPRCLSADARAVVQAALERHYLNSQVTAIRSLRIEGDVCYFAVDTSRGRREFVVSPLLHGLRRFGDRKLLFVDVDGNRFEIDDFEKLDRRSVALLRKVL